MLKINPAIYKALEANDIDDICACVVVLLGEKFCGRQFHILSESDEEILKKLPIDLDELVITDLQDNTLNDDSTDWIKDEYIQLFKDKFPSLNPQKTSPAKTKRKMLVFLKEHPDVTKEEILEATRQYLFTQNSPIYVKQTDYFIFKGSKNNSDREDSLLDWILAIREKKNQDSQRNSLSDTIQ